MSTPSKRRLSLMIAMASVVASVAACATPCAGAAEAGVGWNAFAQVHPTNLPPGGGGTIQIYLMNNGAERSEGSIVVTDQLPAGVTATAVGGMAPSGNTVESQSEEAKEKVTVEEGGTRVERTRGGARWNCVGVGTEEVRCTSNPAFLEPLPTGEGEYFEPAERLAIAVHVQAGLSGSFANQVTVEGGGAREHIAVSNELTVSAAEPVFGFSGWNVRFTNADGTVDTQAGSHPYETTFALGFNELADGKPAGGEVRDIEVELPPGFFGEPNAVPRCTRQQLDEEECPADTEIGNDIVIQDREPGGPGKDLWFPVFNMVPPQGVADEVALKILGKPAYFDTGPQGYGKYKLVTHIDNIPALPPGVIGNVLTLWGVASEKSHDAARTYVTGESEVAQKCKPKGCSSNAPPRPFLTLPTSCEGPQEFTIRALNTWEDEAATASSAFSTATGFTGCANLAFAPSLAVAPETSEADTAAGLAVTVGMPQQSLRAPDGLVESTIKNTTVTLPEGFVINPGQAAGLQACQRGDFPGGDDLPLPGENTSGGRFEGPPKCPLASKVGRVRIVTPLLEGELESELTGNVYVLAQSSEKPNLNSQPPVAPSLQLLIAASGDGVNLKLEAEVQLNRQTGQLTTTVKETPGLPFKTFELSFSGGAQAALATPAVCGSYTATSDFTPWTSLEGADALLSRALQITSGPAGGACPTQPLPFHPELIAGSTTDEAGGFTDFSLLLRRGDGQQRIERLQFKAPPGLLGTISTVGQCPEPQASQGECSESSRIGSATVASGPGPYPLVIPQPGNPESPIYLTGPYDGAPFGLSIVTHVIAGPFDLGKIVTRARIEIDPVTAQIVVTTDPLPQIVDGVPTDLRLIDSVIDRPHFMINPTNCEASSLSGTAWGAAPPGLSEASDAASIGSRFQVGSCRSLQFKPTFKVSTSAHTSRTRGASLSFHLSLPDEAGEGAEANVRKVKVSLPKKLPTPLKTLQKACVETVFAANPANCPEASKVATARVATPLLPGELTGTAYFVSHGGARYPELVIVLSGDGVTEQVHGETFISKQGITTGTFSTVPDVPFTSFELTFPQSQYPAFTADGDLCKGALKMPTEMVGQNGLVIHQTTKIAVAGCKKKGGHRKRVPKRKKKR